MDIDDGVSAVSELRRLLKLRNFSFKILYRTLLSVFMFLNFCFWIFVLLLWLMCVRVEKDEATLGRKRGVLCFFLTCLKQTDEAIFQAFIFACMCVFGFVSLIWLLEVS